MTVKIRKYRRGGYEVDIRFTWPDGEPFRQRLRAPVTSKSASQRWGEARELELLRAGKVSLEPPPPEKEVPTLKEFKPRYMDKHAKANRLKASSLEAKESLFSNHLLPRLGEKRLDRINDEDVQAIKADLATRSRKTVNNVIALLGHTLRIAMKWKVIGALPCTIELYKVSDTVPAFYEFEDYARLVEAAERTDARTLVAILLGGDAGLRRGEIVALRQIDVDLRRRQIKVEQNDWRGIIDTPKGGRGRIIPMTDALASALTKNRHLRGDRVLTLDDGSPVPGHIVRDWVERAQRRAGLEATGNVHILRHTFCSHLAMHGAPAKAIQELAGHEHMTTTLRYMHLSPAARRGAIDLLNARGSGRFFGDIVETAGANFVSERSS